jgi:RimJ/RimL family protein N-acetyltransferase
MLEGKLVQLRAPEPDDKERAYQWINDREVTKTLMARYPISRVEEENWLNHNAATPQGFLSEVRLAIIAKDTDTHIGFMGLHKVSPESRHAELGIMIGDKSFWERGYGTDAILTLVRFAFDDMNLNKVKLGVFDINSRAQAVYRKIGFVEDGRLRQEYYQEGRYRDVIQMSILRDEFYALHGVAGAQEARA